MTTPSATPSRNAAHREKLIAKRVDTELRYVGTPLADRPLTTLSAAQVWRSRTWFRWFMTALVVIYLLIAIVAPPMLILPALLIIAIVAAHRGDAEVAARVHAILERREREAAEQALREARRYLTAEDRAWFAANHAQI